MFRNAACASFAQASRAAIFGLVATLLVSSVSLAAQPAAKEEEDEELTEVQVTGTRIQSPNVTAANPVTSITGEEMRRLGIVNVADAITTLVPQNISTYMPTMVGDTQAGFGGGGMDTLDRGSFFIGNTIANLRGLDPTFGTRTLTLIDGRRSVSTSNQADVVDLNTIPSNLLERMDVVTGGASATYGSGAMAGVVNLVLSRRMTGVNLDLDYGVNEAGDGSSPHVSLSGGMPLLGGRAHVLLGVEWQKQAAIRDCAAARDWCAESRAMFSNNSNLLPRTTDPIAALPGFEGFPARFEMENVRLSQFAPTGTLYVNDSTRTSNYRFSDDGTDVSEYSLGYRGGVDSLGTPANSMNGDGPLVTSGQTLTPSNERKSFFTNLEYDLTSTTTAYFQGRYATTDALNKNRYTRGNYCTRFDVGGSAGTNAPAQAVWTFGTAVGVTVDGVAYAPARTSQLNGTISDPVRQFLGLIPLGGVAGGSSYVSGNGVPFGGYNTQTRGLAFPFWIPVRLAPNGPSFNFGGNAIGRWVKIKFNVFDAATYVPGSATNFYAPEFPENEFWVLDTLTLTNAFDIGTTTALPQLGRNSYAFLNNMSPEALYQVQRAFNNSITTGGGAGLDTLYGANACNGFTAVRKVWNPQLQQFTSQASDTWGATAGMRGRFGDDWRWEAYYQYGATDSTSKQNNVATNLRLAFAMDAVIDDRPSSATYGQPICRIKRDGPPILDSVGRPLSNPEGLAALADGCKPINIFGNSYSSSASFDGYGVNYNAAQLQQEAIDYAFVESVSSGRNSLQQLSFTTNGTLWQGWAGPLTGAFGLEFREDTVDNKGSKGDFYLRADLARTWADAFGGKTRVGEGYAEFNLPLVTGQDGINQFSINAAVRYGVYNNKGGAGTTGESATQSTPNWKFSTEFAPFDWVRFRLTRSSDLRAATYRDLFIYQPSVPDQFAIRNPWRERTASSTENQQERYGQVRVGNSDLDPEKSNTLTLGLVLSPGGWAQGMRFTMDYYNIRVKDGINTPFNSQNPVNACWEQSGNVAPVYVDGNLESPGINGLFAAELEPCKELAFAVNEDGSRNLEDLVSYNSARPRNSLPYQRRGIDFNLSYTFPLNRAFEDVPGSLSLTVRGTRALESSGVQQASSAFGYTGVNPDPCGRKFEDADPYNHPPSNPTFIGNRYTCLDLVGQIGSSVFIPGVAATPKWTGNIVGSYLLGDFTGSLSARYVGGANFDNLFVDDPADPRYYAIDGRPTAATIDNNRVNPYVNLSFSGSYNLSVANMKQFQVFGTINNLFDKSPPFTGGGISGASAQYSDTLGRAYRMGVRMKF